MLKIGVIGTSGITSYFCECVNENSVKLDINLYCVYSRNTQSGLEFSRDNHIENSTNSFSDFLSMVDIVYVASPNSIHYQQAKDAILAKKHVLIEKPLTDSVDKTNELFELAKAKEVFIMEALTTISNPLFHKIKNEISDSTITHIDFKMMQQSRHYKTMKSGDYVTVFDKNMGGGALNDLGVYIGYLLISLVGTPNKVNSYCYTKGQRADLTSTLICEYDNFVANLTCSKISFEKSYNQIICEEKTIAFDHAGDLTHFIVYNPDGSILSEERLTPKNRMQYELEHFIDIIRSNHFVSEYYTKELAIHVSKLIQSK